MVWCVNCTQTVWVAGCVLRARKQRYIYIAFARNLQHWKYTKLNFACSVSPRAPVKCSKASPSLFAYVFCCVLMSFQKKHTWIVLKPSVSRRRHSRCCCCCCCLAYLGSSRRCVNLWIHNHLFGFQFVQFAVCKLTNLTCMHLANTTCFCSYLVLVLSIANSPMHKQAVIYGPKDFIHLSNQQSIHPFLHLSIRIYSSIYSLCKLALSLHCSRFCCKFWLNANTDGFL